MKNNKNIRRKKNTSIGKQCYQRVFTGLRNEWNKKNLTN